MSPIIAGLMMTVGVALAFAARGNNSLRGGLFWTGLTVSAILLCLWLASLRFAFGYIGGHIGVYYESGGMSIFTTNGALGNPGWLGIGRSRFPIVWFFECPAMVPLTAGWISVVAIVVPTALVWKRERLHKGHCTKCDYDLTGNTSSVCPECGTAIIRKHEINE